MPAFRPFLHTLARWIHKEDLRGLLGDDIRDWLDAWTLTGDARPPE